MRDLHTILICLFSAALLIGCDNRSSTSVLKWTPPSNPKPQDILNEASSDAESGEYLVALEKHVWFHENSLKYQPSLAGVRLSFALSDWIELGAKYPQALERLKSIRDEAGEKVRKVTGREAYEAFMDFEAISEALGEDDKTRTLFVWLDSEKPDLAKELFDHAEPALIKSKEFHLCGKYLDSEACLTRALQSYQRTSEIAKKPNHGKDLQDFADKKIINETTTLIALLVVNDRKKEAQDVADRISKETNLPDFKSEIQKALNGELPTPWP